MGLPTHESAQWPWRIIDAARSEAFLPAQPVHTPPTCPRTMPLIMTQPTLLWLAAEPMQTPHHLPVLNKHDGSIIAEACFADPPTIEAAIQNAWENRDRHAEYPVHRRQKILRNLARIINDRRDEFAALIAREGGKTIDDATVEVDRSIDAISIAADEVPRIGGEYLRLDTSPRSEQCEAIVRRVAAGVVSCITPFNFPLLLTVHKVAPAIAAGCPFLVKPAPATPLSSLLLGTALREAGMEDGFSVLPCLNEHAGPLTEDDRIAVLSFTGSGPVGWMLKERSGRKRVLLELGGNAACIIDETADIQTAARRVSIGGFYQAGQSCISVQRVLVEHSVLDAFTDALVTFVQDLKGGNPLDPGVFLSPLISEHEAQRVEKWVNDAVAAGAQILCGGSRDSSFYSPTVLRSVPHTADIWRKEIFGPVVSVAPFESFDQACVLANDSDYGLHCGLFSNRLDHSMQAWRRLEVGGVVVNDVPSFRTDNMPYGGVKESGLGREGIRYAIEEFTELKTLVLRSV